MNHPRFWAKTGQGNLREDGQPQYHPVICHLADTAAVAMEMVRTYLSPIARKHLAEGLGLPDNESLVRFCGFMAGSHDLGKVSAAFQFQVSNVGRALVGKSLYDLWHSYPTTGQKTPHGTVTAATLPEFLKELGLNRSLARKLAAIVGGHHGFFPGSADLEALSSDDVGRGSWAQFRRDIYEQLRDFVGLVAVDLPSQCDNAAAMILAGLTTVSDWIASNPEEKSGFPYANDEPFATYQTGLAEKAKQALKAQGWSHLETGKPLSFTKLFPLITIVRPLQDAAIQLTDDLTPPCLVMVEASMGEGKTEAALYLADHLQHQSAAGGFYIGLPTQATSNAMFKRVQEFLQKRYDDKVVNLTLSHGAAALKGEYLDTVCRLDQVYDHEGRGVFASEWHTARKRTLLSPFGVGTLDQGLMGVVRSRHQFVRLFGLAGRTIILDEIHAYDLYTSTLLERFLEWAAVLGSPVIALSATLPASTRQRLLTAYATGCNQPVPPLPEAPYPRITAFANGTAVAQSFAASEHVCRELGIHWVKDEEWPADLSQELSDRGGCVAVICSTVNRAQEVYQQLQDYFPPEDLGLFHGRFLFKDRETIEADCLRKFGKGDAHRPQRFVLVATQVIEQSLDVDFDLMISDLAPIDLLLQRSGRLHRHKRDNRPAGLNTPQLWIVAPSFTTDGKADFGVSKYIYERHILLRSWLALRCRHHIQLPDETDELIGAVYDPNMAVPENIEPIHAQDWQTSRDEELTPEEQKKLAKANEIKLPPPHGEVKPCDFTRKGEEDDEGTIAAATRLGEPSVATIFLQRTDTGLVFPGTQEQVDLNTRPDLPLIRKLLAHSTRLSKPPLVKALLAQDNPPTWTSALLRNCRYVEVNAQRVAVVGDWRLTLDPLRGVLIEKEEAP
ncbi:CRISPR-associated helicase Cas3' [Synechococcales cyanobacterium C]|uniref:CRISPR-associated helicase Cas3 n=1 Tax=Petrachloros mirabilis ULC683 TaxID=2781853 RepID=A0A8K1ZWF4_9CYAN|nr:CRISPR-associated helicase Cas3' [Petrachloros mirabilis]NCJ05352.1 CRISPR-associated helicase Cas3' [Petrachloros mirabilis ULC683]